MRQAGSVAETGRGTGRETPKMEDTKGLHEQVDRIEADVAEIKELLTEYLAKHRLDFGQFVL